MSTDLFYGNTFVLFLVFVISVFTVDKLSERQKITIIYLCVYGIAFSETIPERILLPMMMLTLFLMQEFFTADRKKVKILRKIHYKIMDFLFMGIFQYKIWLVCIAISIRTSYCKNLVKLYDNVFDAISVCLFIIAFVWIFELAEEFYSFTDMYDYVWKTPYYNVNFDDNLRVRLEIITCFEDELYWEREKTYSSFSFEYLYVWIKDHKSDRTWNDKHHISMRDKIKKFVTMFRLVWKKSKKLARWLKRIVTRGHSTIPMQLIRILSYRHGLVFGSTKIKYKYYRIFKRKIYEVIYSRMFFEGLKNYLTVELCNNLSHYREYIVYLYPHIVQTTIDGKVYSPAKKAFVDNDNSILKMNDWDITKVIRMGFGFNGLSITEKRMIEKRELLDKYDFKN